MRLLIRSIFWIQTTVLATVLALAAPLPAAAQESASATADQAEVEFRLGNEAYVKGDYTAALAHYFASIRLVPNRNVIFNIAKCYENLGSYVEAYRYYTSYLESSTDEQEKKQVEAALARIGSRVGLLVVSSHPSGATIFLNRRDLGSYGETPAVVPVKPGNYTLILDRAGHETVTIEEVNITGGERVEKTIQLPRLEAQVRLVGTPPDVIVTTPEGLDVQVTLPGGVQLPLGRQQLTVKAPGYRPRKLEVLVEKDVPLEVDATLERETGTLVVQASELNSAIFLDGQLVGFSPSVVDDVPVGPHQLVIRQEGFRPYEAEVEVAPNQRVELEATLVTANEVAAASRRAESLREAPASVSLISSREISAFGYTGTKDALLGTRGFFYTDDLTYLLPGIRGYGPFGQFGNRTLVLLDGHAINDSWLEASFHEFEILTDLYGLDRIEVVRGPTSVLYGSGAFQGVINLAAPPILDEFQPSRVGISAVADGTARSYAHVREVVGPVGLQLTGGVVRGQPRDYFSAAQGAAAEDVGDFWGYTLRANARWSDLSLYSFFHSRDKQSPTGAYETIFGDRRNREQDTRGFVDLRYDRRLVDAASIAVRTFLDYYAFDGTFAYEPADGGVFTDTFEGIWGGAETRLIFEPFAGARWTVGFEAIRHFVHDAFSFLEGGETAIDLDTPFTKLAASAMARQEFTDRVALWLGARYDLWLFDSLPSVGGGFEQKTISNVNPRLVLLLRPVEPGNLKLIGSRGFRAPSVYELTYNDAGVTQIAAPGLVPETIWSAEVEYTHELDEHWDVVLATYLQQIDDRIESTGSATAEDPLQFQNIEEPLWSGGAEAELRRTFFRGWMASGQYSYQKTRGGGLDELFVDGRDIANSPAHLAALKLVAPIVPRALNLANRVVFESPRIDREGGRTVPVLLWDMAFSGEMTALGLRYMFGVRNLLDWQYEHPVGDEILDVTLPQAGRTFIMDLALQF